MTEEKREPLKPHEPLHNTYVKHRRRHFGSEISAAIGPADADVELLVRAVIEEELHKLASQFRSYPGNLAGSAVAQRLRQHAERVASWAPTYYLDVWWKDGRHEELTDMPFTELEQAAREASLMLANDPVTRVEVFYR